MRIRLSWLALSLSWLPLASVVADEPQFPDFAQEIPEVKTGDPVLQFNGKDLTGFYTFLQRHKLEDPNQVFTVKDGLIRISGEEYGGIITKDEYSDYVLEAEWKWGQETHAPRVDRARDSGVLLHCVGEEGVNGGPWMESQECQLIEGGCGDFILVGGKNKPSLTVEARLGPDKQYYFQKGAEPVTRNSGRYNWWGRDLEWKDVIGFRDKHGVEKPSGEWNHLKVICDGDTISIVFNGVLVNQGTKSSHTKGKLLFQSEGAEMFWRKIELRPIVK